MNTNIFARRIAVSVLVLGTQSFAWAAESARVSPEAASAKSDTSKALNPDISANLLGLYQRGFGTDAATAQNGFSFQEAELQFTADVDPYLRGVGTLAVTPRSSGEGFEIEAEEAYFQSLSLPVVTLQAGKFKSFVGRHNRLHTHAFPFLDAPLANQRVFGEEGLNDVGAAASVLIPAPWFLELTVEGQSARNPVLFGDPTSTAVAGVGHLRSLWEISDALTTELGVSAVSGQNFVNSTSQAYGGDLTVKWRPVEGGKYRSLAWSTEYLAAKRNGFTDRETEGGVSTWLQYQFAQRWWAQARTEFFGIPRADDVPSLRKQSLLLGFFPSEFSGFRLQYDRLTGNGDEVEQRVALQWNISIGAHPAHGY
jgi:hypothetical protein